MSTDTIRKEFSSIYRDHSWGGSSKSGPGSDPDSTLRYRRFLERFLRERNVQSVVDLGCGDWASSRLIDWSGIDYVGLDVVDSVIERNQEQFGRPGIRFAQANLVDDELPGADLAICKEVLQHLPSDAVHRVLEKLPKYKMAILVNDSDGASDVEWRNLWRGKPFFGMNIDVPPGSYRPLQLRKSPFNLDAQVVLTYWNVAGKVRWHKEVLLWTNPAL